MIYSGKIRHSENITSVCLVGGADKTDAMKKILQLYKCYQIDSISINEIQDDMLGKTLPGQLETFYVGGMVLSSTEDEED